MPAQIREILDPRVMRASYQQVATDRPTPLTDTFFSGPDTVDDNEFRFFYDPADNTPAPLNRHGAQARELAIGTGKERFMSLFSVFNSIVFPMHLYTALREPDSPSLQQKGRTEVARINKKFAARHRLLKELIIAKSLATGVVYADANGKVLETSSGADIAADLGVPANNQGNLNGLITALFSAEDTDIPSILESIVDQANQNQVPVPTDIWVHQINLKYLRNNDYFADWAVENPDYSARVLRGEALTDLWGFNWHFLTGYYTASDGTQKPIIPKTKAILTPPPGDSWKTAVNGPTIVPTQFGPASDAESALDLTELVYGEYAFASVEPNPTRVTGFMGDNFGFGFAEPGAVWQATAFPS